MSRPQTPEPALDVQGDSPTGSRDEDAADGTQHSHRMLNFSDALLSIIATVMVRAGPFPLGLPRPAPGTGRPRHALPAAFRWGPDLSQQRAGCPSPLTSCRHGGTAQHWPSPLAPWHPAQEMSSGPLVSLLL